MLNKTLLSRPLLVSVAMAGLVAGTANAEGRTSKEESIGVGAGAVVGAVAGGPVGLIVGAAIGAKIGDEFHARNERVDVLQASLASSHGRVTDLESEMDVLASDLQRVEAMARPEYLALLQAGIEMDLLFRTDEHVLADTTGSRLSALATTVASMVDIRVRLDGYADERGDADYNQALSQRRAEHVRDVLVGGGIPASRIEIAAHGESPAADENIDSLALERRVSLTLYLQEAPSFAATPN